MQSLQVVSLNIWHIVLSLANLLLLFLILKKFLFKPVTKVLEERRKEIDRVYAQADEAQKIADGNRERYEAIMESAGQEADAVIRDASERAERRASQVLTEAQEKAEMLLKRNEQEIRLEKEKARDGLKREIADISLALAEKVLEREIDENDGHRFIDLTILIENDAQLYIVATNSFDGKTRKKDQQYLSTKHAGEAYGIDSVRSIAESYGGVSADISGRLNANNSTEAWQEKNFAGC